MGKRGNALIVALSTLVLAGCDVSGVAQRAPLDIDPGQYAVAATDKGTATANWQSGAELGAYLPFPADLDKRLVRAVMGTTPVGSLKNLGAQINGAEKVPENKKFLFGFGSAANDSDPNAQPAPGMTQSMHLGIYRYTDAAAVRAAIKPTAEMYRTESIAVAKKLSVPAPEIEVKPAGSDLPEGSYLITRDTSVKGKISTIALVPHGDTLLMLDSYGLTPEDTAPLVRKGIAAMIDKADGSDSISESNARKHAKFLSLTVPFGESGSRNGFDGTVVTPSSYAHLFHDSVSGVKVLSNAGVDLIAVRESALFRAADDRRAQTLSEEYGAWAPDRTERKAAPPRDLPSASCTQSETRYGDDTFTCKVVVGRYFAQASSSKTLLDAQQMIAAQYLILKERG